MNSGYFYAPYVPLKKGPKPMYLMKPYDDALQEILDNGVSRTNTRTGIKTLSVFGIMKRYRLDTEYFPILTRRKSWPKSVFGELLWFLSGSTSNEDLRSYGCNFWTPWVDAAFEEKHGYAPGHFGPVYGFQLRHFGGEYGDGTGIYGDKFEYMSEFGTSRLQKTGRLKIRDYGAGGFDQLMWMVNRIKEDPSCRRILFSLWNPKDTDKMRLPPCHYTYQVMIDDDRRMTGMLTQRSCDFPIGIPANIQFYSALTVMLAQQTDCQPHEFVHSTADSHIYENQIEAVKEYLALPIIPSPKLMIKAAPSITEYTMDSFELGDFKSGPKLDIPVAV